jgi:sugar phosphate isomerase/epimerase
LHEAFRIISKLGYSGVEILCDIPHAYPRFLNDENINEIKKSLRALNLEISNLNAFTLFAIGDTYNPSWVDSNKDRRKERTNHTIECIRLAKKLGAKSISTEPGGPIVNSNSASEKKELLKIFISEIEQVLPIAEDERISILVEPEPKLLIQNSNEFVSFINNFDSNYLKLNFDIGHFYCVHEDPAELIIKLAHYIGHFHIEDISRDRIHNHLILGEGSIDFATIFDSIKNIGYEGFVTVELYPYQDCPEHAGRKSMQYLNSLIK